MSKDLEEPQIQDIAEILQDKYTHSEMKDILLRFDAEYLDRGGESNKKDRIKNWLRKGNESDEARKILAYMIEDSTFRKSEREELKEALVGSRLVLCEEDSGLELMLKINATAERQVETHQNYTEKKHLMRYWSEWRLPKKN